ncbi:ABC transporter permease [uncultured Aquimonas sp.]|uniref:ABC transporter permease n=1 Tax=uncultured Aquimonas sp. TaxID=385483 RepID=UPI000868D31F|nr:ABC transporter permease [uncultured Aquimonas sp.]ODU43418.1 MAG: peptide ABC transporter permease [Xanthomonadaceae bacterium SCN 69-123]
MSALLRLAWASLANRRFTALVTVATIALSVLLLLGVERLRSEARNSFLRTVAGTDLIVGARAHPVQLLLYSVFHLGDATNNVSWASYREIAEREDVAWTVPISLGDSHKGYRVVGTTAGFFEHVRTGGNRELRFEQGEAFDGLFEAVLGAEVAERLGYALGDSIVLAHGTGTLNPNQHDDRPFTVVGVLARTGTPIDHSVHVSLEAIEAIHINWRAGTRIGRAPDEIPPERLQPRAITAFFVGLESRMATFAVQRAVNEFRAEPLTAVLPGVALQQLWGMLGVVEKALMLTAACVVAAGLLGMLAALLGTLSERRREMAILRALGAGPGTVSALLLLEALLLTAVGLLLGLALLHGGLALLAPTIERASGIAVELGWPSLAEFKLLGLVLGAGVAVGLIPAFLAYRRSLADGMMVRQ